MASMILVMYFEKYSGTAIGIKHSGGAMSSLVFPYLLLYFKDEYGIRGTILLYGGLLVHLTALGLLLREPTWVRRGASPPAFQDKLAVITDLSSSGTVKPEETAASKESLVETLMEVARLFRSGAFYTLLLTFVMVDFSKTTISSTIVDYGEDKQFSLSDSESVIAYSAASDVLGYVFLPMLADRQYIDRITLTVVTFVLLGVLTCLIPECASYGSFTAVYLLLKMLQSCGTTMRVILIVDCFGSEKLPTCWGIGGFFSLPLFLLNPSIIGT